MTSLSRERKVRQWVRIRVKAADLVTDVQGEEEHQQPGGRVAAVVFGPAVVDVLKEGRVEDLHLRGGQGPHRGECVRSSGIKC